jgi:hypothetical protein
MVLSRRSFIASIAECTSTGNSTKRRGRPVIGFTNTCVEDAGSDGRPVRLVPPAEMRGDIAAPATVAIGP